MTNKKRIVYWDSCVFLSYINGPRERMEEIDKAWDEIANSGGLVYTSAVALTEVAFGYSEKENWRPSPSINEQIESFWADSSIVVVEFSQKIAKDARILMPRALEERKHLKPMDAIHLATAQWLSSNGIAIDEIHTYDEGMAGFGPYIGIRICIPYVIQQRLV